MRRLDAAVLTILALGGCAPTAPGMSDAGTDAPPAQDAGADAPARWRGFVMLERWERTEPAAAHAIAAFTTMHDEGGPLPHYVQLDEHCGYHLGAWSPPGDEPGYGQARFIAPNVGEVLFSQLSGYDAPAGLDAWDTGDELRVVAPGGELPGFDLSDTVPARVVLTSFDLERATTGSLTIPRTDPFELTWEPSADEVFALFLQFYEASSLLHGVWCFFPGDTGSGSIPPEALSHLESSADIPYTNFYFSGASRQHLELEGVDLTMITWNGRAARVLVE